MNTKQLRQKILARAISGKLVPQDPNDEPASLLLERIRAEKERLIKEGKIKRDKKDSAILRASDKPHYEKLPQGWVNCTINNICEVTSSKRIFKNEYINFGIPFYRTKEIVELNDKKPISTVLFISEKKYKQIQSEFGIPKESDILLSAVGTIGISWVVDGRHFYFKDGNLLWLKNIIIDSYFLKYILDNIFTQIDIKSGTAYSALTIEKLKQFYIPLPPLPEQRRIVAAIESAFTVIDEIERNKSDLLSAVTAAKSKILSLAVNGKLVPQDPNDEPAINTVDRSHYNDLPENWAKVKLDEVLEYQQPTEYIVESVDYDDCYKIPVLTAGKSFIIGYTNEKFGICKELPVIIFDDFTTDSKFVDFPFKVKSSAMKILRANGAEIKYLYYLMQTIECDHSTHKRYWISDYSQKIIPLPPLPEQRRIVSAIESAFSCLDEVVKALN